MFSFFRTKRSRTSRTDKNKKKSNTIQSNMHTQTPKIACNAPLIRFLVLALYILFAIRTHTHPFNGPFFQDYPGEPVPER